MQGVWLEPELRGKGLSAPAMAAVVQLARTVVPTVSLYVNDYNLPARATYARVDSLRSASSRRFTFEGPSGVAGSAVDRAVDHVWLRNRRRPTGRTPRRTRPLILQPPAGRLRPAPQLSRRYDRSRNGPA